MGAPFDQTGQAIAGSLDVTAVGTNPLGHSPVLDRLIRQDGIETLGISSLTLAERAARAGDTATAADLLDYFLAEIQRMTAVLFTWIESNIGFRMTRMGTEPGNLPKRVVAGIRTYDPSEGDLANARACLRRGDVDAAIAHAATMRVRLAALHDAYVAWIQEFLREVESDFGEEAVFDSIELAYHDIWEPRYVLWARMTPLERLQLSVEGMRGHLSGTGRRGDVGIAEESDRYVMILDPCGSCGILRRGDPESGRLPADPAGNRRPHPWTWGRIGVGWYAVHSPIVMEFLQMRGGRPPLRPLEGCDTDGPCRWFIYKDAEQVRPEHYLQMGFAPPPPDGPA